jgi:ParB family chromosome partitioning protein
MTSGNSPNCVGLDANLEDNVREYANLNKPFLDSIAEHGVLQPITAIRRADGVVEVRNGQRRTMAARKLGLSSIPVYVVPATAADAAAETIERIVHQIVTNDQDLDLTDAQRARAVQQLIDLGLSVPKVANEVVGDTLDEARAKAGEVGKGCGAIDSLVVEDPARAAAL